MDKQENIDKIQDLIETKDFSDLTDDEKKLALLHFDTQENYKNAFEFNKVTQEILNEEELPFEINAGIKANLLTRFKTNQSDNNMHQGSFFGAVSGLLTSGNLALKMGMAASLIFGSMLFTNNQNGGGHVFAADSASVYLDTSHFSLPNTLETIKDTIAIR